MPGKKLKNRTGIDIVIKSLYNIFRTGKGRVK
jgi:hypothetical protein